MSDPTYRAYCKAQNAFFLCKDVSQLPALKEVLDAAEKAYREAHPGAYYQAQQQVADARGGGPSAGQRRSLK